MAQSNTKLLTRSSSRATVTVLRVEKPRVPLLPLGHVSRLVTSGGFKVKSNWGSIRRPQKSREPSARCAVPLCSLLPSKPIKTPSVWHWARLIVIQAASPCAMSWLAQKLLGLKSPTIYLSQRRLPPVSSVMLSNPAFEATCAKSRAGARGVGF